MPIDQVYTPQEVELLVRLAWATGVRDTLWSLSAVVVAPGAAGAPTEAPTDGAAAGRERGEERGEELAADLAQQLTALIVSPEALAAMVEQVRQTGAQIDTEQLVRGWLFHRSRSWRRGR